MVFHRQERGWQFAEEERRPAANERIYEELNLGGLEDARPNINKYLESVKDYEKNVFPDLTPNIIERINKEWDFAFKAWNYDKVDPNTREILNK